MEELIGKLGSRIKTDLGIFIYWVRQELENLRLC